MGAKQILPASRAMEFIARFVFIAPSRESH
jgi:hypothetical protein